VVGGAAAVKKTATRMSDWLLVLAGQIHRQATQFLKPSGQVVSGFYPSQQCYMQTAVQTVAVTCASTCTC
jgi:hypothetical protein